MSTLSPYQLAAGMLHRDRVAIGLPFILLVISEVLVLVNPIPTPAMLVSIVIARRLIELVGLSFIFYRWARIFSGDAPSLASRTTVRLVWYGFAVWIVAFLPRLLLAAAGSFEAVVLVFALWGVGFWALYIFFLYGPVVLGGASNPLTVTSEARAFTKKDKLLPIKILLPGFALSTGIGSLILLPAPDGSHLGLNILAATFAPTFWLLQTYLATAWYFVNISDSAATRLGIHQYREGKLTTAAIQGPSWLGAVLEPRRAGWGAFVAVLLWLGNMIAAQNLPPTAVLQDPLASQINNRVTIDVTAHDKERSLRGFSPTSLNLRNEQGELIISRLEKCSFSPIGGEKDVAQNCALLAPTSDAVRLHLEIVTKEAPPQTLSLWYRNVKLLPITVSPPHSQEAAPTAPTAAAAQGSEAPQEPPGSGE